MAVAALLALGGLVVIELLRPAAAPTPAEQARQIAAELRCPDCQALSVAESETAAAADIRRQIVEQLAAGRTPAQVRDLLRGAIRRLDPAGAELAVGVVDPRRGRRCWGSASSRGGSGVAGRARDGCAAAAQAVDERIRDEVERLDA